MTSPLHHIRLERAREPGAPLGDSHFGYDLVAPLNAEGRLDPEGDIESPSAWRVRHFEGEETVAVGRLRHTSREHWRFHFQAQEGPDVSAPHLGDERFALGDYVSVKDAHGQAHTFKVAQLQRL